MNKPRLVAYCPQRVPRIPLGDTNARDMIKGLEITYKEDNVK